MTEGTKIKNYPVQGFATADIVPMACIEVHKHLLDHPRMHLVNTVHDSVVLDVHEEEVEQACIIVEHAMTGVPKLLDKLFSINFDLTLDIEMKVGYNWLNNEIYEVNNGRRDKSTSNDGS